MNEELSSCSKHILNKIRETSEIGDRTLLSLQCLIKIYFRMAQKVDYDQGIEDIKSTIHLKGINLAEHSLQFNTLIRKFSEPHLREGMTVLVHSYSSVVLDVIQGVSERGLRIKVITTEGMPSHTSEIVREKCAQFGVECEQIYDTAVAISMPMVDCVLVGCEAVLANGGIVNKVGTYGIALIAQHFQKPVYVFCESYKFSEEFPLNQEDVQLMLEAKAGKNIF